LGEVQTVTRDNDPVEDTLILPDILPRFHRIMTSSEAMLRYWTIYSRRILVRSEYYETEQAALSANKGKMDVFVVTGQPGIGLPISLSIACRT
jgi:hypothetical protein